VYVQFLVLRKRRFGTSFFKKKFYLPGWAFSFFFFKFFLLVLYIYHQTFIDRSFLPAVNRQNTTNADKWCGADSSNWFPLFFLSIYLLNRARNTYCCLSALASCSTCKKRSENISCLPHFAKITHKKGEKIQILFYYFICLFCFFSFFFFLPFSFPSCEQWRT
jgi:hypothetical protein